MLTSYSDIDTPDISSALNNCALNCALPTLFTEITRLSTNPHLATESYILFKTLFERWYKFQEPISWLRFSELIGKHNFSENQLIFAPILRQFMRAKGAGDRLWSIRQDTGRYSMLHSEDANQYFFQHFNLFMQQHQDDHAFIVQPELGQQAIQVYHRDAHFELKPMATHTHAPEENRFGEILKKITGNASQEITSQALIQLQSKFPESAAISIVPSLQIGQNKAIAKEETSSNSFLARNNIFIAGAVTFSIGVISIAFALAIPIACALGTLAALTIVALIALAIKSHFDTPEAPLDLSISNARKTQ